MNKTIKEIKRLLDGLPIKDEVLENGSFDDKDKLLKLSGRDILKIVRDGETVKGISKSKLCEDSLKDVNGEVEFSGLTRKVFREGEIEDRQTSKIAVTVRVSTHVSCFEEDNLPNGVLLERILDRSWRDIVLDEDNRCVALFDEHAGKNGVISYKDAVTVSALEDLRYAVEKYDIVADKFLINRKQLSDLVKNCSGHVDPTTDRELIMRGIIGFILNSMIIVTAGNLVDGAVKPDELYVVTGSKELGVFTEWEKLSCSIEMVDDRIDWVWKEVISMEILCSKGIANMVKEGD